MRDFRRKLATFLAVLLIMPSLPIRAEELPASKAMADTGQQDENKELDDSLGKQASQLEENETEEEGTAMAPVPTSPEVEEGPEETELIESVREPETVLPEASISPETTASPEASAVPEPSNISQTSSSPFVSASPEQMPVPEASSSPEATVFPETADAQTVAATPEASVAPEMAEEDKISFNTGNHGWSIVSREAFEQGKGDGYYEEDGSYTINIPEANPFFPYEVQFTCNGEETNQWFMTPDDSVEIGGHTFYVSAYFDNTAVTQMTLNVAGSTVIVWPEEKEFTEESEGGISEMSLLPLAEKNLTVDLSAYTPVELTMVSADSIFTGTEQLRDTDKIIWTYSGEDDYTISESGNRLDLSHYTANNSSTKWQMITGEADQLASDNTRYIVEIKVKESRNWLIPEMYYLDDNGNRDPLSVEESYYSDYGRDGRTWTIMTQLKELRHSQPYCKIKINPSVFESTVYDHFKVYDGQFGTAEEAEAGRDITDYICETDKNYHGYFYSDWITIVTFDGNGNATGCLPIYVYNPWRSGSWLIPNLFEGTGEGRRDAAESVDVRWDESIRYSVYILKAGLKADATYYLDMSWFQQDDNEDFVIAAYVGEYSSQEEAISDGAVDIKDVLFSGDKKSGYAADFSKGVYITVFEQRHRADGYSYVTRESICFMTEEGEESAFNSGTGVYFSGLKDRSGADIPAYVFPYEGDSYGENNYLTILVGSDVDLTSLAPVFSTDEGIHLYAAGSTAPEVSGGSLHDFSKGAVQYTASAENGSNAKNYWLQVVRADNGISRLYINSLADTDADTRIEDGIIYSKREMMLDGYHNYVHDIWLANTGTDAMPALSAELISDVVKLDDYWTLNGNFALQGVTTVSKQPGSSGELPNLAKIRLMAKDGVENGTDISGVLRIKSAGETLMELTLTGTVGDPCIITDEVPEAVKYVPYGSMIQNNNKYSWNKGKYSLTEGSLPAGMEIKRNGELYGVPSEIGEFTFTVCMDNSFEGFTSDARTYTLKVIENTDANVDAATDAGYELLQRVQNISLNVSGGGDVPAERRTLVSEGIYSEFVDIFLDGVKLAEGTDYTSESGSTRITILTQTLTQGGAGTHTLGVEFRTGDTAALKRAAQNYRVEISDSSGNSGENSGGSSSENSSVSDINREEPSEGDSNNSKDGGDSNGDATENSAPAVFNSTENGNAAAPMEESAGRIIYIVEAGDSLWKIAEKFYGSGTYWRKIYEDNADIIRDPDRIYAGQEITIYLTQETSPVGGDTHYTVESGDTLWKIARKLYGRGWRWRRIYEANIVKIENPEYIYAGQVLFIPE